MVRRVSALESAGRHASLVLANALANGAKTSCKSPVSRRSRKPLGAQAVRGFKSLPLRFIERVCAEWRLQSRQRPVCLTVSPSPSKSGEIHDGALEWSFTGERMANGELLPRPVTGVAPVSANARPPVGADRASRSRERRARLPCPCACAQVGEHSEHPPVRLGISIEPELEADLLHVGLDGALGHEEPAGDCLVRESFRHEP